MIYMSSYSIAKKIDNNSTSDLFLSKNPWFGNFFKLMMLGLFENSFQIFTHAPQAKYPKESYHHSHRQKEITHYGNCVWVGIR